MRKRPSSPILYAILIPLKTMPSETSSSTTIQASDHATKSQPWKAHWPPNTTIQAGDSHGFKKGEIIHLEGTASAPPKRVGEKGQ